MDTHITGGVRGDLISQVAEHNRVNPTKKVQVVGRTNAQIAQDLGVSLSGGQRAGQADRRTAHPNAPQGFGVKQNAKANHQPSAAAASLGAKLGLNAQQTAILDRRMRDKIKQQIGHYARITGKPPGKDQVRAIAFTVVRNEIASVKKTQGNNKPSPKKGTETAAKPIPEKAQVAKPKPPIAPPPKPKPPDTPPPPKPKTHGDLIEAGAKLMPKELAAELDKLHLHQSQVKVKVEQARSIMAELHEELNLVRSGKGQRTEAEVKREGRQYRAKIDDMQQQATAHAEKLMDTFRSSLINTSSLSPKQAEKMARAIKIDKNAATVIPEHELRSQAAEFFRLTGGKGAMTIDDFTKDTDRAYADPSKKVVNIGASGKKSIVFHEMAHHLEFADDTVGKASVSWIRSRATGQIKTLNEIMGTKAYRETEIAFPDTFINPYVGKVYATRKNGKAEILPTTEVVSMGVERFSDAKSMVDLYIKDPDHFKFVLGAIRNGDSLPTKLARG